MFTSLPLQSWLKRQDKVLQGDVTLGQAGLGIEHRPITTDEIGLTQLTSVEGTRALVHSMKTSMCLVTVLQQLEKISLKLLYYMSKTQGLKHVHLHNLLLSGL